MLLFWRKLGSCLASTESETTVNVICPFLLDSNGSVNWFGFVVGCGLIFFFFFLVKCDGVLLDLGKIVNVHLIWLSDIIFNLFCRDRFDLAVHQKGKMKKEAFRVGIMLFVHSFVNTTSCWILTPLFSFPILCFSFLKQSRIIFGCRWKSW